MTFDRDLTPKVESTAQERTLHFHVIPRIDAAGDLERDRGPLLIFAKSHMVGVK